MTSACSSLRVDDRPPLIDAGADQVDAAPDSAELTDTQTECSAGCKTPPKAGCNAGNTVRYNPIGRCENAKCVYAATTSICKNASCDSGVCEQLDWADVSPVATKSVYSVWGAAPDDIWAVGVGVYHFDGTSWTAEDVGVDFSGFAQRAWSVHGSSAQDVTIMVSNESNKTTRLLRRVNGAWATVSTLTDYAAYGGAVVGLGNDRFLMNLGGQGLWLSAPNALININNAMGPFIAGHLLSNSLSLTAPGDALVANYGPLGSLLYKTSSSSAGKFAPQATAISAFAGGFGGIYAGNDVWLYKTGTVALLEEDDMQAQSGDARGYWQAISGTSLNRLFVGGTKGIVMRRSASGWAREPALPNAAGIVQLWASPWGDVYAAGTQLWRGK